MQKKFIPIIVHITGWILFLTLPFIFFPQPPFKTNFPPHIFFHLFLIQNCFLIGFFYLNYSILIPRFYLKKKYLLYTISILALLLMHWALSHLTMSFSDKTQFHFQHEFRFHSPGSFFFFLILLLSSTLRITQQWFQTEQKAKEMESEKLHSELAYLKAQVNPHFLFNTLNNIYTLALMKNDRTAEALLKLSHIMRYVTQEAQQQTVALSKEIDYLQQYIELQQLRLNEKTSIRFITQGNFTEYLISPLLLIPFVENAFKYGISSHDSTKIEIMVSVKDGLLLFSVENEIVQKLYAADSSSIGISNTRRRLELTYPGKHELAIKRQEQQFLVTLQIYLK